jgi:hypothetical protein
LNDAEARVGVARDARASRDDDDDDDDMDRSIA